MPRSHTRITPCLRSLFGVLVLIIPGFRKPEMEKSWVRGWFQVKLAAIPAAFLPSTDDCGLW